MNNNLLEQYYDKFIYYLKKYRRDVYVRDEDKNAIRIFLAKIIDQNLDYLLTDSFICYISDDGMYLHNCLYYISGNKKENMFNIFICYFKNIVREKSSVINKQMYSDMVSLLSDDIKEAISKFLEADKIISNNKELNSYWHKEVTRNAILTLLTVCFMNNSMNTFSEKCDRIMENQFFIIDDLKVNDIMVSYDQTVQARLLSIINNLDKNVIR